MSTVPPCKMCGQWEATFAVITISESEIFLCNKCEEKMQDYIVEEWQL